MRFAVVKNHCLKYYYTILLRFHFTCSRDNRIEIHTVNHECYMVTHKLCWNVIELEVY